MQASSPCARVVDLPVARVVSDTSPTLAAYYPTSLPAYDKRLVRAVDALLILLTLPGRIFLHFHTSTYRLWTIQLSEAPRRLMSTDKASTAEKMIPPHPL